MFWYATIYAFLSGFSIKTTPDALTSFLREFPFCQTGVSNIKCFPSNVYANSDCRVGA
jgi:hypothetical protein